VLGLDGPRPCTYQPILPPTYSVGILADGCWERSHRLLWGILLARRFFRMVASFWVGEPSFAIASALMILCAVLIPVEPSAREPTVNAKLAESDCSVIVPCGVELPVGDSCLTSMLMFSTFSAF